jgi:hypothetical protein
MEMLAAKSGKVRFLVLGYSIPRAMLSVGQTAMTDPTDTIDWFRHTAPYINSHRGTTVVVGLRQGATADKNFINVVHDLALMHSLGVRLVVVHEQRSFDSEALTLTDVDKAVAEVP